MSTAPYWEEQGLVRFTKTPPENDYPGVNGVGFEKDGLRFVMYGPDAFTGRGTSEHGPAHIHAIHIATGHETRFELVEHYNGSHYARPFVRIKSRDGTGALSTDQEAAAQHCLNEKAPVFLQLWREMYHDQKKDLSQYVTRREPGGIPKNIYLTEKLKAVFASTLVFRLTTGEAPKYLLVFNGNKKYADPRQQRGHAKKQLMGAGENIEGMECGKISVAPKDFTLRIPSATSETPDRIPVRCLECGEGFGAYLGMLKNIGMELPVTPCDSFTSPDVRRAIRAHCGQPEETLPGEGAARKTRKKRHSHHTSIVTPPPPPDDPHAPRPARLGWLPLMQYQAGLPDEQRQGLIREIRGHGASRQDAFRAGAIYFLKGRSGKDPAEPCLFLPRRIKESLLVPSTAMPDVIRDVLQVALGLKDEQRDQIGIGIVGRMYKVTLPALATQYDASTGDPELTPGRPVRTETQTGAELAEALHAALHIPIMNTAETAIDEQNVTLPPPPRTAPAVKKQPAQLPELLHPERLSLPEFFAYARSLPEAEKQELLKDSKALSIVKDGAIYFSRDDGKPAAPATGKPKKDPPPIKPGDAIAPFLYVSMERFQNGASNAAQAEKAAAEAVRDILQFYLGLDDEQAAAIEITRGTHGTENKLLKVKIPSITYRYDAVTHSAEITPGHDVITETLTPRQVAEILNHPDALDIPFKNLEDTPVLDNKVVLEPRPKPPAPRPPEDPHQFDLRRKTFADDFAQFSRLPRVERKAYLRQSPEVREISRANIYFLKGRNDEAEPHLFFSQHIKDVLRMKDGDVESMLRDILQSTLGLRNDQFLNITLEKGSGPTKELYKVKLPSITYAYDAVTGDPEITDGHPIRKETLYPMQIARILNEELGIRIVGRESHPLQERNVRLVPSPVAAQAPGRQ